MKRINKILIPTITALSTVALLVPSTSIATSVVNNSTNNSSVVNSITYVTVKYNTITNVTLDGPTSAKARSGSIFGSIQKPRAVHAQGYVFKGWSETEGGSVINETTTVSKNLSLYPVFEAKTDAIKITADTTLSPIPSKLSVTFTATGLPIAPSSYTWEVVKDAEFVGTASIDASTGVLTTSYDASGTLTIKATGNGVTGSKTVKISPPYVNDSNVWVYNVSFGYYGKVNLNEICSTDSTTLTFTKLDQTTATVSKSELQNLPCSFYIGDQVTSIPDNFMIGKSGGWSYEKSTIVFPSTTKCTTIGKCFMQDCSAYNSAITLPSSIKMIDDGFMMGCTAWNNGGSAFTIPTNTTIIGRNFLKGCKAFAQDLTVPESVTYVGDSFMTNCDGMNGKTISIYNDPDYFVSSASPYSLTLTTSNELTNGVTIKGMKVTENGTEYDQDKTFEFIKRFPNRDSSSTPYRKMLPAQTASDFATCDWSVIIDWAQKVETGEATIGEMAAYFGKAFASDLVGLEKTITINNQVHTVRLIGVQHSTDLIVNSGVVSSTPATFTFELKTLLSDSSGAAITKPFNTSQASPYYNVWNDGTQSCDLRNYLTSTFKGLLPSEIQNSIKTVRKSTNAGNYSTTVNSLDESIWCLSMAEVYSKTAIESCTEELIEPHASTYVQEGSQYAWYKNKIGDLGLYTASNLIKKYSVAESKKSSPTATVYFLRTPFVYHFSDNNYRSGLLNASGVFSYGNGVTTSWTISPCFCI